MTANYSLITISQALLEKQGPKTVIPTHIHVGCIFDAIGVEWPSTLAKENVNVETATGIVSSHLVTQMKQMEAESSICFQQIAYCEIQETKNRICDIKKSYSNTRSQLYDTYAKFKSADSTTDVEDRLSQCPKDETIIWGDDGLWIQSTSKNVLVWDTTITTLDDMTLALIHKYDYFCEICDLIVNVREYISQDMIIMETVLNNHIQVQKELIKMSARKCIENAEYNNMSNSQKQKYRDGVRARFEKNILFPHYHEFLNNTNSFAYHLANTEGLCNNHLYDFLIDHEVIEIIGMSNIAYPWLQEQYLDRIDTVKVMLCDAYNACLSPGLQLSPTTAYAVIWVWMLDKLHMAKGATNAIPMFTMTMNQLTESDLKPNSIQNEVTDQKRNDLSDVYKILSLCAFKAGFITKIQI